MYIEIWKKGIKDFGHLVFGDGIREHLQVGVH